MALMSYASSCVVAIAVSSALSASRVLAKPGQSSPWTTSRQQMAQNHRPISTHRQVCAAAGWIKHCPNINLSYCFFTEDFGDPTGNGIYLTACGAYFLDNAGVYVAPQLGATGRSPEASVEEEYHELMLREFAV